MGCDSIYLFHRKFIFQGLYIVNSGVNRTEC